MRALIAEDDTISSQILTKILSTYGSCDVVANGKEAVDAFQRSLDEADPYTLICMDIMMPELDGQEALRRIRKLEKAAGISSGQSVKVVMTTSLNVTREAADALFKGGASAYFVKPLQVDDFIEELKGIGVIPRQP
ncbi:MAG: response regulator [Desulfobacteraceae bacterium]|jgi:two-component system chemotaxis response regulator CheY